MCFQTAKFYEKSFICIHFLIIFFIYKLSTNKASSVSKEIAKANSEVELK